MLDDQATSRRDPLTRDRVIEAALQIMHREGLEGVTMRRIGRELGVEAMSLYSHVRDKEDILDGVTEAIMSQFLFPPESGDWTKDVRTMAAEWRRLLSLHPGVIQLLAERHKPLEGIAVYRPMDAALGVLRDAGLTAREAAQAFNALGGYIMGFVMMELGLMPGHGKAGHADAHEEMGRAMGEVGLTHLVECFKYFIECDTDEQFEFGLDLMIGGI
ncbi:MAG TPA: TetR/AcrR family transcriptional regulator C-terminal domain-containing protein, partial [Actinomycetota bacterium]|nr:TetR/AcrR family transcriptional regulator C-terminal domain-containing protein [Actinomycetota bacterium]